MKPGDTVFVRYNSASHWRKGIYELRVEKVGRRWVTIGGGRFDIEPPHALDGRGYSSPGRAFLTREALETHLWLSKLTSRCQCDFHRNMHKVPLDLLEQLVRCWEPDIQRDVIEPKKP